MSFSQRRPMSPDAYELANSKRLRPSDVVNEGRPPRCDSLVAHLAHAAAFSNDALLDLSEPTPGIHCVGAVPPRTLSTTLPLSTGYGREPVTEEELTRQVPQLTLSGQLHHGQDDLLERTFLHKVAKHVLHEPLPKRQDPFSDYSLNGVLFLPSNVALFLPPVNINPTELSNSTWPYSIHHRANEYPNGVSQSSWMDPPTHGSPRSVILQPNVTHHSPPLLSEQTNSNWLDAVFSNSSSCNAQGETLPCDSNKKRLPALLALPEDQINVSDHQAFLRYQIEAFQASYDDIRTHTRGRNKSIHLGQVGIRCRHCAYLPVAMRQKGAVYYPSTLKRLYQAAQNMSSTHLQNGLCSQTPEIVKRQFALLLSTRALSSGAGREYWANGGRKLGLVDTSDGIRFVGDDDDDDDDGIVSTESSSQSIESQGNPSEESE